LKRQAESLLTSLREFIDQPDYPTLVMSATDLSIIIPNRMLANLDKQDEDTYYLLYPETCVSAQAYMDAIAASIANQLEILNTEFASRNLPNIPSLPLQVSDSRYLPAQRLQLAIEHCGEHLPGNAPIVWGLLPAEMPDPAGYRALVAPLLAMETVEPWMDRHRFLLRDPAERPRLLPELAAANNDRVLVMEVDFSNESFVQDLAATAKDKSLPSNERMNAFFMIGVIDFSFKRYPAALEKFGACFNYFEQCGSHVMQGLCLNMAGDTLRQAQRPRDALKFYQQTVAKAVEDKNLPLIQQGTYNAGLMSLELSNDTDAAGYFKHADETAAKLNNPYAKCDAMEKRGLVAWRLGKIDEAVDIWIKGKDLAKQFDYNERAASILDWLIALCRQAGLRQRVADFEVERATLGVPPAGSPQMPGAPVPGAPKP
jgi:tetratricopeptide (TPR) repeat protein